LKLVYVFGIEVTSTPEYKYPTELLSYIPNRFDPASTITWWSLLAPRINVLHVDVLFKILLNTITVAVGAFATSVNAPPTTFLAVPYEPSKFIWATPPAVEYADAFIVNV
jgi:hypothetical protein